MRNHVNIIAALILTAGPSLAGETKEAVKFRFDRAALQTEDGARDVYQGAPHDARRRLRVSWRALAACSMAFAPSSLIFSVVRISSRTRISVIASPPSAVTTSTTAA